MKKNWIWLAGIAAACVLAACSPETHTEETEETVFNRDDYVPVTEFPPEKPDRSPVPNDPAAMEALLFVYRGAEDGAVLERVSSYAEELTDQGLVDKLAEYGVLEEGTQILSFEIEGDEAAGPGMTQEEIANLKERIGYLDLTQVPSLDAADEKVMLNCIAATFMDNYLLAKVKLKVEGKDYESDYLDKDGYLVFDMRYKNVEE